MTRSSIPVWHFGHSTGRERRKAPRRRAKDPDGAVRAAHDQVAGLILVTDNELELRRVPKYMV